MTELIHQEAFCFFKAVAFDELNKDDLSVPAGARQESLKVFVLSSFSVRKFHVPKTQNNLNQMRQCLRQEHEPCKGFVLYKQAKKDASFPSLNSFFESRRNVKQTEEQKSGFNPGRLF